MQTAEDIAADLGISGKTLRAWLRKQWRAKRQPYAQHEYYGRWEFTDAEAAQVKLEYSQDLPRRGGVFD